MILLSLFVAGITAGAAMAHCSHAVGGDHSSMMKDSSGASVDKMSMEAHGCHDMNAQNQNASDKDNSTSNCRNCKGSVCQSPSLTPALTEHGRHVSTAPLHSEEYIHLYAVSRAIIPDPPKQLS